MENIDESIGYKKLGKFNYSSTNIDITLLGKVTVRRLRFELPFVVMVADGFSEGTIPTDVLITGMPYEVPSEEGALKLWFRKRTANPDWLPAEVLPAHHAEFYGSICKNTSYSDVLIEFSQPIDSVGFSVTVTNSRVSAWTKSAIEALRTFLAYYKLNNFKHYIPQITEHSIGVFRLYEIFEKGQVVPTFIYHHFEKPIPFENTIGVAEEVKIRESLQLGQRNAIHELYVEVWNKMGAQDWRLVAIPKSPAHLRHHRYAKREKCGDGHRGDGGI